MSVLCRCVTRAGLKAVVPASIATARVILPNFAVNKPLITSQVRNFSKKNDKNDKKSGKGGDAPATEGDGLDTTPFTIKMDNHVVFYKNELSHIKVGRPTPEMLQDIPVEVAGKKTALKNIAQVYAKPPQSLVVSLFEPSDALETATHLAISNAGMDLNPVSEVVNGVNAIVVPFPKATRELRDSLIKQAKTKAEDTKTGLRHVRKLWMDAIKKANPPKDDAKRMEKDCQTITDKHIDTITELCSAKEKEINNS